MLSLTVSLTESATGLTHLDARWYNPYSQRFVQPDYWSFQNTGLPIEVQHELLRFSRLDSTKLLSDPSQQLAYGYVAGNALAWNDQMGLGLFKKRTAEEKAQRASDRADRKAKRKANRKKLFDRIGNSIKKVKEKVTNRYRVKSPKELKERMMEQGWDGESPVFVVAERNLFGGLLAKIGIKTKHGIFAKVGENSNKNLLHTQAFGFVDGKLNNIGYTGPNATDGVQKDPYFEEYGIKKYRFRFDVHKGNVNTVGRKVEAEGKWKNTDYKFTANNCQDFTNAMILESQK